MILRSRVAKLELINGGRAPTEREFSDALQLLERHFEAIGLTEISARMADEFPACGVHIPDLNEVLLMKVAEASGRIAAAREVRRRYWKARGIDVDRRARWRWDVINAILAELLETSCSNEGRPELS